MAGDWIKMRHNLDTDYRVIEIASTLGMAELHVIGCLWKLWTWADSHTLDGNAIRVTSVTLDRFTGVTGFSDALRKVGWLDGRDGALSFPRFAEHNGQTAKKRAETKERVAKHRNAKSVTDVTQSALPEKRREEKRRDIKTNNHGRERSSHWKDETFQAIWLDWVTHVGVVSKPLSEPAEEAALYDLEKFSTADAIEMVRYSLKANAKNLITNGDHKKPAKASGVPQDRKQGFEVKIGSW